MRKFDLSLERKDDLEKGKKAEKIVFDYLTKNKGHNLIDVTDIQKYRNIDVDFLMKFKNRDFMIEVKSDEVISKSKNFYLEYDMYLRDKTIEGWMTKSKADYLIYYCPSNDTLYILDFNILREWAKNQQKKKIWDKKEKCYTDVILLNINIAIKKGILKNENIIQNVAQLAFAC